MKKILTLALAGAVALTAATGTAQAQQSEKERKAIAEKAIEYAESIAYYYQDVDGPNSVAAANRAFLFYTGDDKGYGLDVSVEQREPLIGMRWVRLHASKLVNFTNTIAAGNHMLMVPLNGGVAEKTDRGVSFDFEKTTVNFEAGKRYTINRSLDANDRIVFSIRETPPEEYTAFQRENPALLDGTWSGESKNLQGIFTMHYTIGGGRMKFEGTRGKRPFVTEGRIIYNENTIIFFPEKAVANGKDVNNLSGQNPYIWYYTLDGDVLRLETNATWGIVGLYARPFRSGATGWINDGDLRRTNQ